MSHVKQNRQPPSSVLLFAVLYQCSFLCHSATFHLGERPSRCPGITLLLGIRDAGMSSDTLRSATFALTVVLQPVSSPLSLMFRLSEDPTGNQSHAACVLCACVLWMTKREQGPVRAG